VHLSTGVAECRDVVSEIHKQACEADSTSLNFVKYILDHEKPDFVALTGDQVNGDNAPNTKSVTYPDKCKINRLGILQACRTTDRSKDPVCRNLWQPR